MDYPFGRGRTPLWLDYEADGRLDVYLGNTFRSGAPPALFGQDAGEFMDRTEPLGLTITGSSYYAQLLPVLPDQRMTLVPVSGLSSNYPNSVWATNLAPAEEISEDLGLSTLTGFTLTQDTAIADLDGDLDMDIFVVRQGNNSAATLGVRTRDSRRAGVLRSGERGFAFTGGSELEFNVQPGWFISRDQVFLGQLGVHPPARQFSVSALDAEGTYSTRPVWMWACSFLTMPAPASGT